MKISNLAKSTLIIGHRGFRARYPENTMSSFEAAAAAGAGMIELDVHLTRDRRLAVIHDETLSRTTSGEGNVADCTMDQLKSLDAGTWFTPEFADEKIPELGEVLAWACTRLMVNIEIKSDPKAAAVALETGRQVLAAIEQTKTMAGCIVSSFNTDILTDLRNRSKDLAIGVLTYKQTAEALPVCSRIRASAWHPHYRYFSREELDRAHGAGLKVLPYTVNSEAEMAYLLKMGVDGFFTDDPLLGMAAAARGGAG